VTLRCCASCLGTPVAHSLPTVTPRTYFAPTTYVHLHYLRGRARRRAQCVSACVAETREVCAQCTVHEATASSRAQCQAASTIYELPVMQQRDMRNAHKQPDGNARPSQVHRSYASSPADGLPQLHPSRQTQLLCPSHSWHVACGISRHIAGTSRHTVKEATAGLMNHVHCTLQLPTNVC
jgi:hypothetical protein